MKGFCFGLLCILLMSCGGQEDKEEDSTEDVARTDTADSADTVVEEVMPVMMEPVALENSFSGDVFDRLDSLANHFLSAYDTLVSRKNILPERFGSERKRKITLRRKDQIMLSDSTQILPEANIWVFHFSDTTQMQLVTRNWFLEFGDSRTEIGVGEPASVSGDPMFVVMGETDLIVLQTSCKSFESFSWEPLENSFKAVYNQGLHALRLDCSGRLEWY